MDRGLLSPVTNGHDAAVSDGEVFGALVEVEVALVRIWEGIEAAPEGTAATIAETLDGLTISYEEIAARAVAGGNPVIPLVAELRSHLPEDSKPWLHRGATSQDILDTALMLMSTRATGDIEEALDQTIEQLHEIAYAHANDVAAARTLTQHAVPTTIGARLSGWVRGIERSRSRMSRLEYPAQLGGAGGTLASFVEMIGEEATKQLPGVFAELLNLSEPDAPWQVNRWPVTELGDALAAVIDAAGKIATDIATLSRTEIGEVSEGVGGGSSAMPQKQNPVEAVLIRSAAIRAPQLAATLHLASALAADERPDGAWHAEWPTLRELLRLALGVTAHLHSLIAGLNLDVVAAARNVAVTGPLIVSERLGIVLTPYIGAERFTALIAKANAGADLAELLRALPELDGLDVDELLDPLNYLGLAPRLAEDS
ncbi:MAG: lyase family protein [Microbacterium sp.]